MSLELTLCCLFGFYLNKNVLVRVTVVLEHHDYSLGRKGLPCGSIALFIKGSQNKNSTRQKLMLRPWFALQLAITETLFFLILKSHFIFWCVCQWGVFRGFMPLTCIVGISLFPLTLWVLGTKLRALRAFTCWGVLLAPVLETFKNC